MKNTRTSRSVALLTTILVGYGMLFFVSVPDADAAACTNTYASGAAATAGYGVAWNPFTTARELLLQGSDCTATTGSVKVGNTDSQYVYKLGYYWDGSVWKEYSLSGNNLQNDTWFSGSTTGSVSLSGNNTTYFVAYVCQQQNNAWKCGCKDEACTQSYWQLQGISAGSGGGGNTGGGLPSELIPFAQPSKETLKASKKLVLAHWHQYPISRGNENPTSDYYSSLLAPNTNTGMHTRLRPLARPVRTSGDWLLQDALIDIKWAQAIGVDGFFMNVSKDFVNRFAWPEYINYLKAAHQLNTGFLVAPNLDCTGWQNGTATEATEAADKIFSSLTEAGADVNPNRLMNNGKFVVGSFHANLCGATFWQALRTELKAKGLDPWVACIFLGAPTFSAEMDAVCDGWGDWGSKNPSGTATITYSSKYSAPKANGEPVIAAISHGDVRYKVTETSGNENAYEEVNTQTLRTNWEKAITTGADWAQLVTWNDIGEHSQFYPNTADQFLIYDLSAYYIAWFKTGTQPNIVRDALYYSHRKQLVPPTVLKLRNGTWSNKIELLGFLTAPGTLEIWFNGAKIGSQDVQAGVQVISAQMPTSGTGKPQFKLVRNGNTVIDLTSAFAIGPAPSPDDVIYRGGGSLRTEYGKTHNPTTICTAGDADACLMAPGEPVWLAK